MYINSQITAPKPNNINHIYLSSLTSSKHPIGSSSSGRRHTELLRGEEVVAKGYLGEISE